MEEIEWDEELRALENGSGGMKSNMSLSGGTACDLLMTDGGVDFRAAKDIDLASGITAACLKVCSLTSQAPGLRIGKCRMSARRLRTTAVRLKRRKQTTSCT